MKNFYISFFAFIIGLSLFFNIERLDFGVENVIDVESFVYLVGFVAICTIIAFPICQRVNIFALIGGWACFYLALKLSLFIFFAGRPLLGGIYTYLSITEITFLLLLVLLTRQVSTILAGFKEAIEKITFTDTDKRIRRLNDAEDEIQVEMFRSRHNHHPLSIIVVEPELRTAQATFHRAVQEIQQAMLTNYIINSMTRTLTKYLRRTDLVLEQRERGRFVILCPDANSADLKLLVEYIQNLAKEVMDVSVTCGTATFPDEALTFDDLLHKAEARLNPPTNQPECLESRSTVPQLGVHYSN